MGVEEGGGGRGMEDGVEEPEVEDGGVVNKKMRDEGYKSGRGGRRCGGGRGWRSRGCVYNL